MITKYLMNQYNIRKDLPSVKVDKALIEQLENYILFDVPSIIGIDKELILKNYSLEIVDSLGSAKFSRISEFPFSIFQNGTEKIIFGSRYYSDPYFCVQIYFSKRKYSTVIEINLKCDNPSALATAIYNEILLRIKQYKAYNSIYHNDYLPLIGGASIGIMLGGIILLYFNFSHWGLYIYVLLLLISFIAAKGEHLKPYCEFSTSKQLQNNRTFNYIVLSIIIPLVITILYDVLK